MIKPAYDGRNPYIFVSYAHKDKTIVYPFIELLQAKYNVWYDEGISYGAEWTAQIIDKLSNCSLFIFLITKHSIDSENCKDEIHAAREEGKNFINIIFDKEIILNKEFMFRYGRFQMCNLYNFNTYNDAIEDLAAKCEWFNDVKKEKETKRVKTVKVIHEEAPIEEIKEESDHSDIYKAKEYDEVKFGKFFFDETKEPIEWIVLINNEEETLLLSKYILFGHEDNGSWSKRPESGSLGHYLNTTFYDLAFSNAEKEMIDDSKMSGYKIKVMLLSTLKFDTLLPTKELRKAKPTPYAKKHGCRNSIFTQFYPYWTLTQDSYSGWMYCINASGKEYRHSRIGDKISLIGVRPMIYLKKPTKGE